MPAGSPKFLRRGSLRLRLLALSLAALAPGLTIVAFNHYEMRAARVAEVNDLALRSAETASSEVDRIVSGVEAVLVTASRAPPVFADNPGACSAYLADVVSRLPSLTSLSALGPDGVVRCSSLRNASGVNLSERPLLPRGARRVRSVCRRIYDRQHVEEGRAPDCAGGS